MKRTRWPLAKLYAECWAAPIVWVALLDMKRERGSSVVTPTRAMLSASTGIRRLQTISDALTTLERALWIDRVHVPLGTGAARATGLRIVIREGTSRRQRGARHTATIAVSNTARCKGKQHGALLDSLTERGTPRAEGGGIPKNTRTPTVREIQERVAEQDRQDRARLLGTAPKTGGKAGSCPAGERNGVGTGFDTPAGMLSGKGTA